jgi:hypothetical protein
MAPSSWSLALTVCSRSMRQKAEPNSPSWHRGITKSRFHQPRDSEPLAIQLERQQINALYFNPNFSYNDEAIQTYIDMIDSTSANAVVIDIKEEIVYFDSKVQLFVDAGTVRATFDLPH